MDLLRTNIVLASEIFTDKKFDKINTFSDHAANADKANDFIMSFLTKLYNGKLSEAENISIAAMLHTLTSLERIGNHTKGIVQKAQELRDDNLEYSEIATAVLRNISNKTKSCYDEAVKAYISNEADSAALAIRSAEEIQILREDYRAGHLERVSGGLYNVQSGVVFMETVRHMSRIASHSKSIAEAVSSEDK
jgi:phosphate:Na+ symporter